MMIAKILLGGIIVILIGVPLYAVPATVTLPPGPRPGVEELTIEQASQKLKETGLRDWELVEKARAMVAERMQYSRRNSFDLAEKAFTRGYGYCQQHSFALASLLNQLGFEAKVVHAFQNRFQDGTVTAHSWVRVKVDDETRDVDSLFYDTQAGMLAFTPLSKVLDYSPAFRLFAGWGSTAVNAHRYYATGKDM
jgi:transglutaminase-like putative cysteine protease